MEEINNSFEEEFNTDVQIKFIGLLVQDKTWAELNGFDLIKPEYFENRILNRVCSWIHSYYKKRKDIPTKLILTEEAKNYANDHNDMQSYFKYEQIINDIYTVEGGDAAREEFKEKVITFIKQAKWKQTLKNGTLAFSINNVNQAIERFKEILAIGTENDLGLDMSTLSNDDFLAMMGETYDKKNMIKTGIPGWDAALGGGFVKDNLHILGGAPGFGKSKTMAYLAKQALMDGKKVVFITLELSEVETMANIKIAISGISFFDMLKPENRMEFDSKCANFENTFSKDLVVKFYKPATVNCDTIENYIMKVIQYKKEKEGRDWKPDVIFVDYLDKLLPTQKVKGNIYEDVGGVATDLKNLAITFDCPVISGSQLGRYTWSIKGDQVVNMDAIAESAQKIHLAHSLTTLNANPAEKEQGKVRLYLAKSRSGIPGTVVWCNNDLGRCKVSETEPWDPNTMITSTTFTIKDAQGTSKK